MADNNKKVTFPPSPKEGVGSSNNRRRSIDALSGTSGSKDYFRYPGGASCRYLMPYTTTGRH